MSSTTLRARFRWYGGPHHDKPCAATDADAKRGTFTHIDGNTYPCAFGRVFVDVPDAVEAQTFKVTLAVPYAVVAETDPAELMSSMSEELLLPFAALEEEGLLFGSLNVEFHNDKPTASFLLSAYTDVLVCEAA